MINRTQRYAIGIGLTMIMAGVYYGFFIQGKQKMATPEGALNDIATQQAIQGAVQAAGERAYKKAYLAPMIATYEKLLSTMPDNVPLQKKLLSAYLEVGNAAKAKLIIDKLLANRDPDAAKYQEQLKSLP